MMEIRFDMDDISSKGLDDQGRSGESDDSPEVVSGFLVLGSPLTEQKIPSWSQIHIDQKPTYRPKNEM